MNSRLKELDNQCLKSLNLLSNDKSGPYFTSYQRNLISKETIKCFGQNSDDVCFKDYSGFKEYLNNNNYTNNCHKDIPKDIYYSINLISNYQSKCNESKVYLIYIL